MCPPHKKMSKCASVRTAWRTAWRTVVSISERFFNILVGIFAVYNAPSLKNIYMFLAPTLLAATWESKLILNRVKE